MYLFPSKSIDPTESLENDILPLVEIYGMCLQSILDPKKKWCKSGIFAIVCEQELMCAMVVTKNKRVMEMMKTTAGLKALSRSSNFPLYLFYFIM